MPRLTAEQWAIARAKWEADPLLTDEQIGKEFGISYQAIHKRRKAEGWIRRADGLAQMAARAQVAADAVVVEPKVEKLSSKRSQPKPEVEKVEKKASPPVIPAEVTQKAVEERVEPRAKVIARQRTEADAPRKLAYEAMQTKDPEKMRLAKLAMETFKGIHEIERKAWGLDALDSLPSNTTNNTVVVIERSETPVPPSIIYPKN